MIFFFFQKLPHTHKTLKFGLDNKRRRHTKPWWNDSLADKWNKVCQAERNWLKTKDKNRKELKKAPFLDLHLSVANGFVSSKIYDKRDDFDFDIVNFPFLDGDVPRRASYGVYISQLIRFARVCNHVTDFNARNKC